MGYKKKVKKDLKPPKLYTEAQRHQKVTNIMLEISMLDITQVITPEIRAIFDKYVKTGETQEHEFPLPQFGRTLVIKLYNDKKVHSFVNLRYDLKEGENVEGEDVQKFKERVGELEEQGYKLV